MSNLYWLIHEAAVLQGRRVVVRGTPHATLRGQRSVVPAAVPQAGQKPGDVVG